MPHFILECSEDVLAQRERAEVLRSLFQVAEASGLFNPSDIKVRLRPYADGDYLTGGVQSPFVHVFAYIMEGRTDAQKKRLSESMVRSLKNDFPDVPVISMNVMEFEKATYHNRDSVIENAGE